jgi:hypothetical protein
LVEIHRQISVFVCFLIRTENLLRQGDKTQVSNYTVAGHGVAFCVTPLIQTRAYFEVTVAELGIVFEEI